jgi:hypothetical protein
MRASILLVVTLLCLVVAIAAKPVCEINLVATINTPEPTFDMRYTQFCVADTILMIMDYSDSLHTKLFCYDFYGNLVNEFKLPDNWTNQSPWFFNYLYGRKHFAVELARGKVTFLSKQGDLIKIKEQPSDSTLFMPDGVYTNAVEYHGAMYYRYWRVLEAGLANTEPWVTSVTWYKEHPDGVLQPLRKMSRTNELKNRPAIFPEELLIDTNKDQQMVEVEEWEHNYIVRFYSGEGYKKSNIMRTKQDHLTKIIAGENFFILATVKNNWNVSQASGMYDQNGRKIITLAKIKALQFKKDYLGLIDIVGNNMFVSNSKTKSVSIYEIGVK